MNKNLIYNRRAVEGIVADSSMYEAEVTKHSTNDTRLTLRYFEGDAKWNPPYRGSISAKLKDNGNGVKIFVGGKKIKLDYAEVEELYLLLKFYAEDSETEVVKTETVVLKPCRCVCECK